MNDLDLCLEVVSRSRQPFASHFTSDKAFRQGFVNMKVKFSHVCKIVTDDGVVTCEEYEFLSVD